VKAWFLARWAAHERRRRIRNITKALNAGWVSLAELRRLPITSGADLVLRAELIATIGAGERHLARLKESA
jgi:hypothetical protein